MLILASASPRRRELLAAFGVPFTVHPAGIDERAIVCATPEQQAEVLAAAKASTVIQRAPGETLIAADTVVAVDRTMLDKPDTPADAVRMLRLLRGRDHLVVTGVAVAHAGAVRSGHRSTRVVMRPYGEAELQAFVQSGAAMDKAGAYAIQDPGFHPVERIEGCYCNVVGLPLGLLRCLLAGAGYPLDAARPPQCAGCPDWS